jgi:ATP-dependent helicase/nuclease subunit B
MADAGSLNLFTIPPHKGFADALADGLIARHGKDPLTLARGLILLPNNRAIRALTDAFVRLSGGGLLLPRMVTIGDEDLGEGVGLALDPADAAIPPAIEPMRRRMILARSIEGARGIGADEAIRLAGDLARVLDQLTVEGINPARLAKLELEEELSQHWAVSLKVLTIVTDVWPTSWPNGAKLICRTAATGSWRRSARGGGPIHPAASRWPRASPTAPPPHRDCCA